VRGYLWKGVHIADMETSHIKNTMNVIEKKDFRHRVLSGGDGWCDEDFINLRPIYEKMRIELRLRALESCKCKC